VLSVPPLDKSHGVEPSVAGSKRRRGRPRKQDKQHVPDALLDAAESLLKRDGFSTLTERKIALEAGVSETNIPYYFGDKNGLLFAVVDRSLSFIESKFGQLMEIDPASPTASLQFARAMIEAHHTRPWIARLMTSEQQRHDQSPIWKEYSRRRGSRSLIQIRTALLRFTVARYNRVTDDEKYVTRVALSLMCVTSGTLSLCTLSEPIGIGLADMCQDPWLQHVAELVDFHLYQLAGGNTPISARMPQAGISPNSASTKSK
jgi:AcrR family transcriptional regulator